MKTVSVTYTVQSAFATQNQANIDFFLQEVKQIGDPGLRYHVFIAPDGKTFRHVSFYTNDESQRRFLALDTFLKFQKERDASGLESDPVIESFELAASSHNPFN